MSAEILGSFRRSAIWVPTAVPSDRPTDATSMLCVRRVCTWSFGDSGCTWVLCASRRNAAEKVMRSISCWNGLRPFCGTASGLRRRSEDNRRCHSIGSVLRKVRLRARSRHIWDAHAIRTILPALYVLSGTGRPHSSAMSSGRRSIATKGRKAHARKLLDAPAEDTIAGLRDPIRQLAGRTAARQDRRPRSRRHQGTSFWPASKKPESVLISFGIHWWSSHASRSRMPPARGEAAFRPASREY